MSNKLSYSKISSYSLCGQRYYLHYIKKYREKWQRSSLLFGSAIDDALNNLLLTNDLEKSLQVFEKKWSFSFVNKKYVPLKNNPDIVYAEKDLDLDLIKLSEEDKMWLSSFKEYKSTKKWDQISEEERSRYNSIMWESLKVKGDIIIKDYQKKIIPQFQSVDAVQHESYLTNSEGDTVVQYLDFVATLKDGSVVLFDNKTTSSLSYYDEESAGTSQQLISYYYNNKETFKLTAVGFIVIQKTILKNKIKICSSCGKDGSESRARTCDSEKLNEKGKKERCNGEWSVTIDPECVIKMIVNPVSSAAEDLVLTTFDEANNGIKTGVYYRNLQVCKNIYGSPCQFYKLCWKGDDSDLIKETED
jgi:hypothetical protein